MRVTLAYPVDGLGQPDDTVDVDRARGRRLLHDGLARPADDEAETTADRQRRRPAPRRDGVTVEAPTAVEVRDLAKAEGISTTEAKRRIRDARMTTTAGDAGADTEEAASDGR